MDRVILDGKELRITEEHKQMILDYNVELENKELGKNLLLKVLTGVKLSSIDNDMLIKADKYSWCNLKISYEDLKELYIDLVNILSDKAEMDYIKLMNIDESFKSLESTYNNILSSNKYSILDITNIMKDSGVSNLKALNKYITTRFKSDKTYLEVIDSLEVVTSIIYNNLMNKLNFSVA